MRRNSDLSGNCRGMARSPKGWWDTSIQLANIQGGGEEKVPSALSVLAASEASLIFWLVKLSGCRENLSGEANERHEVIAAVVP